MVRTMPGTVIRTTALAAILNVVITIPSFAIDVARSGDTLTLSGRIRPGSEFRFLEMARALPPGAIRVVRLNSPGGNIAAATEIGRHVRRQGWITYVAPGARCSSACTVIFAAGTRRHYAGGGGTDGIVPRNGFTGLAYHQGNNSLSRDNNRFSGQATSAMIGMYHEFGSPRAADLVNRAPPDQFWRITGSTALSLGIATSLTPP